MRCASHNHRGFILLMVLLLIPVVAVSAVSVARMSLTAAAEAQDTQQALQRKWGQTSCVTVLLPLADTLFEAEEDSLYGQPWGSTEQPIQNAVAGSGVTGTSPYDETSQHGVSIRRAVTLGGQDFELIFSDEQAKVSINLLNRHLSKSELSAALEGLASATGNTVAFDLKPYTRTDAYGQSSRAYASYGQVFQMQQETVSPAPEVTEPETLLITDLVTCWGGGQLNLKRAHPEAVRLVAGLVLKPAEIEQLESAWTSSDTVEADRDVVSVLDGLGLTIKRREQLNELFIDRSACYALGITVKDDQRSWHWFAVQERTDIGEDSDSVSGTSDPSPDTGEQTAIQSILGANRVQNDNTADKHRIEDLVAGNGKVYVFSW